MYPVISSGCEDFVYESCCPIEDLFGSMEGGFVFENSITKETFEATIDTFPLDLESQ